MVRRVLTGFVLTALLTTTCADSVYAGGKNRRGQDNGTYIQMQRMGQDPQYTSQDFEKAQTELRFIESNPGCCHRAFSGNVGRVTKTILCLAAVGIVVGGSYGLVQALKSQDSSPSDDPFMGPNGTDTSGTDLATPSATTLLTTLRPTPNPLHERLGQLDGHIHTLTQNQKRLESELGKAQRQLDQNNGHSRKMEALRARQNAKIADLEGQLEGVKGQLGQERSERQRLQEDLNTQRQRQQQEARRRAENERQRAENERQKQQECVQRVAREEVRNPQDLENSVRRVHDMPEAQRGPICSDRPIKRVSEECYRISCPTSGDLNIQQLLQTFARSNRISDGDGWAKEAVTMIPEMSQAKIDEYWSVPEFQHAAKLMGRQYTGISPQLSSGMEPLKSHPRNSHFYINLSFENGLDAKHPDYARYMTNVARTWEEVIVGVQGMPNYTMNVKVRSTRPEGETHIASAGPDSETGYLTQSGTVNFREDWMAFSEKTLRAVFGHEFTHMFAGSHLESLPFLKRFDAPGQCFSGDMRDFCFVFMGPKATQAFENMMRKNGLWYNTFYPENDPRRNTRGVPFGNHGHTDLMRDSFKGFCDSHGNSWNCPQGVCINDVMLGWLEDLGYQVDYTAAAKHRVCEHKQCKDGKKIDIDLSNLIY